jgi:hypothetical protein
MELHPDLKRCVRGNVLQHPYLILPGFDPSDDDRVELANYLYSERESFVRKARAKEDWYRFVYAHEPQFRLEAFREVQRAIEDDAAYWRLLADLWTDSERNSVHKPLWLCLLSSSRTNREALMNEDERLRLVSLPDSLTVYRGFVGRRFKNGLSWTLDKAKADWFARQFYPHSIPGAPQVVSGTCAKADVIAYFGSRKEDEIVIRPERVKSKRVETLDA